MVLILAAVILFGGGYKFAQWQGKKAVAEGTPVQEPFQPAGNGGAIREIVVHVDGAVEKPGIYRLAGGSRVADALAKAVAGPEADLSALNLASVLKDGQKVAVPRKRSPETGSAGLIAGKGPAGPVASGASHIPEGSVGAAAAGVVNINTAGPAELETLPGIGPSLAQRIVRYRETNGPFADPSDIKKVSGIGDKKYEQLKDFISIN